MVRFPITKLDQWEKYGAEVYPEQDITAGFYCEKITRKQLFVS
jgi:hypothetical protein